MPDEIPPRDQLRFLADAGGATGTRSLPKIPYVPPSKEVTNRVPALSQWYEDFYRKMEVWRQEAERVIRGPI